MNYLSFFVPVAAPFFLALLLLIAYRVKKWVKTKMKDGKLKRFLLISWN
jgi:hypothetical protein